MNRAAVVQLIQENQPWDVLVIGGGATGIGAALEAATRGYKTLLLEQADFTKSTSSKSTKLVHGGVRYLAQGDVKLVREASVERGLLSRNAPHLVKSQAFVIPNYSWWGGPWYTVGLKLYDLLAGKLSLGPSEHLSKNQTLASIPTLKTAGLRGGVRYYDGQFDDSRLAINVLQTVFEQGGYAVNYMAVTGMRKDAAGQTTGVRVSDAETGREYLIAAKMVINATGVFTDQVLKLDNPAAPVTIRPSQGVHVVLDREFLPGPHALMIPKTTDGRVLFMVPWHGKVIVGTTDTPIREASLEPQPLADEIKFILETAGQYLTRPPQRADVRSIFAGLRPLAATIGQQRTREVSRSHKIIVSSSRLITILGGKWTTFRKMAEDTLDRLEVVAGWPHQPSRTRTLQIHGAAAPGTEEEFAAYGTDAAALRALMTEQPELGAYLSEKLKIRKVQVTWAVRFEMARTVEDVLARRVRALLLDARESLAMAPETARLMAIELGKNDAWQAEQVQAYEQVARGYILA